jgi:hypothetical protein
LISFGEEEKLKAAKNLDGLDHQNKLLLITPQFLFDLVIQIYAVSEAIG